MWQVIIKHHALEHGNTFECAVCVVFYVCDVCDDVMGVVGVMDVMSVMWQGIIKHHSLEHGNTFECVRPDGSIDLSCMDGRILNPLRFSRKQK